jgi:hypothetical protein
VLTVGAGGETMAGVLTVGTAPGDTVAGLLVVDTAGGGASTAMLTVDAADGDAVTGVLAVGAVAGGGVTGVLTAGLVEPFSGAVASSVSLKYPPTCSTMFCGVALSTGISPWKSVSALTSRSATSIRVRRFDTTSFTRPSSVSSN